MKSLHQFDRSIDRQANNAESKPGDQRPEASLGVHSLIENPQEEDDKDGRREIACMPCR